MVNAASVMWTVGSIESLNNSSVSITASNYNSFRAYLVDSTLNINDFLTSLKDGTLGTDVATTGKLLEQTTLTESGRGPTKNYGVAFEPSENVSTYAEGKDYTFYSVIVNADSSYYLKTGDITDSTASPTDAIVMTWDKNSISGLTWTSTGGGTTDVPEPTSGLLLLVGGALLALRRKQK